MSAEILVPRLETPMNKSAVVLLAVLASVACSRQEDKLVAGSSAAGSTAPTESPLPPLDPKNVVSIADGSKDHTTLVKALKAANYVTAVANPGPLTVFAPTNAAFDKLPAGTVADLLRPEKQNDLREILKYHVTTTAYDASSFTDGQQLGMANGAKVTFHVKDGKVKINDANIVASIRASNGFVHVIDGVLLPPAK